MCNNNFSKKDLMQIGYDLLRTLGEYANSIDA